MTAHILQTKGHHRTPCEALSFNSILIGPLRSSARTVGGIPISGQRSWHAVPYLASAPARETPLSRPLEPRRSSLEKQTHEHPAATGTRRRLQFLSLATYNCVDAIIAAVPTTLHDPTSIIRTACQRTGKSGGVLLEIAELSSTGMCSLAVNLPSRTIAPQVSCTHRCDTL